MITEIKALEIAVACARYFYYGGKDGGAFPIMTDCEYDNLEARLKKNNPNSILLNAPSSAEDLNRIIND